MRRSLSEWRFEKIPGDEVRRPVFLAWVPGEPGAVAGQLGDMTDVAEMFATDAEVERLLRGFKWGVAGSGGAPVCLVESAHEDDPAAVVARRAFICERARAMAIPAVMVRRGEWRPAMVRWDTDLVTVAREWFPHVVVTPATAPALLLLGWANTKL
jgi:hypothetical protein